MITSTGDGHKPYTVAIVAMGPSHKDYLSDCIAQSGRFRVADETWAINAMAGIIDSDRAIIMDDLRYFAKAARDAKHLEGYADWLPRHPLIYTSKSYPEYPRSVDYPLKEVLDDLKFPYFNTTTAYAMGLAIHMKVKTVKLYGMDFTYDDNRGFAEAGRACLEYWIATAIARGIKVMLSRTTTLTDHCSGRVLYGYSVPPDLT